MPFNAVASGLLADWFQHRAEVAEPGEGALFVSSRRTRISVRTVERLVGRLASSLPVPRRLYPHLFRHSFATNLPVLGVDLFTCSRLLRHADIREVRARREWAEGKQCATFRPHLSLLASSEVAQRG